MAMTAMNMVNGGSGGTLVSDGLITSLSNNNSYQFISDYDVILVVSANVGNSYQPTYNGVTYQYMKGNEGIGAAALIQDVKSGTTITFAGNIACSIYGYNYA